MADDDTARDRERTNDIDDRLGPIAEEIRKQVSEEVGKAIQNAVPVFLEEMQTNLMGLIHDKFEELSTGMKRNKGDDKEKRKCTYKDFMSCKPTEFDGEIDPITSQRWLTDMEGIFDRSHCDSSDEVNFATGQLRGRAEDWWDNLKQGKSKDEVKNMTWADFKTIFMKHYCPQSAIDRIHEEFLNLRQKNETIDTITGIFYDKAKFCPEMVRTERMKINRFHNMLKADFREFITPSKCETLQELIDWARERELELLKQLERGEKRQAEKNEKNFSPSKKIKYSETPRRINPKTETTRCNRCGRSHSGECQLMCYNCGKTGHGFFQCSSPVSLCFNCYRPGHKKFECPDLKKGNAGTTRKMDYPKPRGRAFQITAEEARVTPGVVTGGHQGGPSNQDIKHVSGKDKSHK